MMLGVMSGVSPTIGTLLMIETVMGSRSGKGIALSREMPPPAIALEAILQRVGKEEENIRFIILHI